MHKELYKTKIHCNAILFNNYLKSILAYWLDICTKKIIF